MAGAPYEGGGTRMPLSGGGARAPMLPATGGAAAPEEVMAWAMRWNWAKSMFVRGWSCVWWWLWGE